MYPCPACREQAYNQGRCGRCGYTDPRLGAVRVVSGQAVSPGPAPRPQAAPASPPPLALDPSALLEVAEDDGPSLPGFESTALVAHEAATPESSSEPGDRAEVFTYSHCPRCRTPQPDPPQTFCPHCSFRVKQRLRPSAAKGSEEGVDCRDCGTTNPAGRKQCVNCGFPLRSGH